MRGLALIEWIAREEDGIEGGRARNHAAGPGHVGRGDLACRKRESVMGEPAATLNAVRLAVRSLIEDTPELASRPGLRRRLAERMVDVSLTAAGLLAEDHRLTEQIRGSRAASAEAWGACSRRGAGGAATSTVRRR